MMRLCGCNFWRPDLRDVKAVVGTVTAPLAFLQRPRRWHHRRRPPWNHREHGCGMGGSMEHGAQSTEHGESGMIHCAGDRSLLAAGCWLRCFRGVAPRVDLVSSSHLRSPRSCETCRVLGARLLDAPLHSRAFGGVNIYCFSPLSSLFPSSILFPPFARHVTNPGDAVMSFHSIPQHPSSFRALECSAHPKVPCWPSLAPRRAVAPLQTAASALKLGQLQVLVQATCGSLVAVLAAAYSAQREQVAHRQFTRSASPRPRPGRSTYASQPRRFNPPALSKPTRQPNLVRNQILYDMFYCFP
ncbi:hypothetical protein EDB80DRAFT_436648 [Ilyonectria destructans]|nr:hypothetical protein EDB80DRAFT_436648 [Ilyonectria destructans]